MVNSSYAYSVPILGAAVELNEQKDMFWVKLLAVRSRLRSLRHCPLGMLLLDGLSRLVLLATVITVSVTLYEEDNFSFVNRYTRLVDYERGLVVMMVGVTAYEFGLFIEDKKKCASYITVLFQVRSKHAIIIYSILCLIDLILFIVNRTFGVACFSLPLCYS